MARVSWYHVFQLTVGVLPLFLCPQKDVKTINATLLINKLIHIFEFPSMLKTKPITKTYQHRDHRLQHQHEQDRSQKILFESDSDDDSSSGSLQEVDYGCGSINRGEFSIESFIDNLQAQESYLDEQEDSDSYQFCHNESPLERINAMYMREMAMAPCAVPAGSKITFLETVRVKFFNDQSPAAEVCSAQQYAISQQYQSMHDEGRML